MGEVWQKNKVAKKPLLHTGPKFFIRLLFNIVQKALYGVYVRVTKMAIF